jgi:hypothetical protein
MLSKPFEFLSAFFWHASCLDSGQLVHLQGTQSRYEEAPAMTFETVVSLIALSLPVWLVAEQIHSWRRSQQAPRGQVESETVSATRTAGPSIAPSSALGALPAPQRKAA